MKLCPRAKHMLAVLGLLVVLPVLAFAGGAKEPTGAAPAGTTLKYWTQFAPTDPETAVIEAAVKEFERASPGNHVEIVHQPTNEQFFALFQSSSVAKTGPDIVDLWSGLYGLRYKQFLLPLNKELTDAEKNSMIGLQYAADGFSRTGTIYGVVFEELQTYSGWYNKELFAKAGITKLPATYAEFLDDISRLKNAGIVPLASGQNFQGGYQSQNEFTYYLMNVITAEQINDLRTGKIKWTDPRIVAAMTRMVSLYTSGNSNQDLLSNKNPQELFATGKTAMYLGSGSYDLPVFAPSPGIENLGYIVIPQDPGAASEGDLVAYPGVMTSVTNYSKYPGLGVAFLKAALTPPVRAAAVKAGLLPGTNSDASTTDFVNTVQKAMYEQIMTLAPKNKLWPMFDNLIQPSVMDALNKEFQLALTQKVSAADALTVVQQAWDGLSDSDKTE